MGTRTGLLTVVACFVFAAAGCGGQGGTADDESSSDPTQARTGEQAFEPVQLSCEASAESAFTAPGADTVVVELGLDDEGELTASRERLVLARGQALKWRSDTLRWRMAFLGGKSPYRPLKGDITGAADGTAMPEGERAVVQGEPGCYHYVVAGVHPESGVPLLLDPPIVVRERE